MKKIIEEVLQAEERVNTVLREAREKASEIKRSADNEIVANMSEAEKKGRQIMQDAVEQAKQQAEEIRQQKLSESNKREDSLLNDNAEKIGGLVDRICEMIVTTKD